MDLSIRRDNGILVDDEPKIHRPALDQPPENEVVDRPSEDDAKKKGGVAETEFSEVKENGCIENGSLSDQKEEIMITKSVENNSNPDDHGEEKTKINDEEEDDDSSPPSDDVVLLGTVQQPHSQLPKPEAPPGVANDITCVSPRDLHRSQSMPESSDFDIPAIGKFFREKSSSLSAAITKRISSLKENNSVPAPATEYEVKSEPCVTEFNLSGLKVIVNFKTAIEEKKLMGRISFFSRSNCRDCTAVRSFLRSRNLNFVEINIDVFPAREKELIERTGNATVPQIFFNEKLFGGLVALNSMRNSGILDKKMEEMLAGKCPPEAPEPPVYGFDDAEEEEEQADEMVQIVRVLRQRLPIQDRLMKMKIVKNCFSGGELVEVLIHHLDCGRRKVRIIANVGFCFDFSFFFNLFLFKF